MNSDKKISNVKNIWRHGRLLKQNPYDNNAFKIVGMSPRIKRRRTVYNVIEAARKVVQGAPGRRQVAGRAVLETDINRARKVLLNSEDRIFEELLEHKSEEPQMAELKRFEHIFEGSGNNIDVKCRKANLGFLELWIQELARELLSMNTKNDTWMMIDSSMVSPFEDGRNQGRHDR